MRLRIFSCDVFSREIAALIDESPHEIFVQFFSKGLHEIGCALMRQRLQEAIDSADPARFDAVGLAYGLCGFGVAGLVAREIPLVLPRAHDCISVLLGGRARHEEYSAKNPGTYFRSRGWLERRTNAAHLKALSFAERNSINKSREEIISDYGTEAGEYLADVLCEHTRYYNQLAFILTGLESDAQFERVSQAEALRRGWNFERLHGELGFLRRLLSGEWNAEEFLVVPPRHRICPTYDQRLVTAEPV